MTTATEVTAGFDPERIMLYFKADAADEARCNEIEVFETIRADWSEVKKSLADIERDLWDAERESREVYEVNGEYEPEMVARVMGLVGDRERRLEAFDVIDRKKRQAEHRVKELTETTLRRLGEARDPDLYAGGEKYGPDAWRRLEIRDLCGETAAKAVASLGYNTVGKYLDARKVGIPEQIQAENLSTDDVIPCDGPIYAYLERRDLQHHWPIEVPAGQQMTLKDAEDGADDEGEDAQETPQDDAEGGEGGVEDAGQAREGEEEGTEDEHRLTVRVIGSNRVGQIAKSHGLRLEAKGKGNRDRLTIVERIQKAHANHPDRVMGEDGSTGWFCLERDDGMFQMAEFIRSESLT